MRNINMCRWKSCVIDYELVGITHSNEAQRIIANLQMLLASPYGLYT